MCVLRGGIELALSKFWKYVLFIYLILLINFVILKFYGDIGQLIDRMERIKANRSEYETWNVNLTLFGGFLFYKSNAIISFINLVGNTLPFIPLGFLIPINFNWTRTFLKTIIICMFVSIGFETMQFITCLGYADIDDVMLNTLSCIVGYVAFKIYIKRQQKLEYKSDKSNSV